MYSSPFPGPDTFKAQRVDEEETFQSWTTRSDPEYLQKLIVEPTEAKEATMLPA